MRDGSKLHPVMIARWPGRIAASPPRQGTPAFSRRPPAMRPRRRSRAKASQRWTNAPSRIVDEGRKAGYIHGACSGRSASLTAGVEGLTRSSPHISADNPASHQRHAQIAANGFAVSRPAPSPAAIDRRDPMEPRRSESVSSAPPSLRVTSGTSTGRATIHHVALAARPKRTHDHLPAIPFEIAVFTANRSWQRERPPHAAELAVMNSERDLLETSERQPLLTC